MILNLFGMFRPKPHDPFEQLAMDQLRAARIKLEHSRDKTLKQIRELQGRNDALFQEGVQSDQRTRKDIARRMKENEEQIHHLDQQLIVVAEQVQAISRLTFLKENRDQMVELGIDKLLGKMDTGELKEIVGDVGLNRAVTSDRLKELNRILGDALGTAMDKGEDPEIARLMAEMERASMGDVPELGTQAPEEETPGKEPPQTV